MLQVGIGIALLRVLTAWSVAPWDHPDEWFQSAEIASLLAFGRASHVQEISLHLRNLAFPEIFGLLLRVADLVAPGSAVMRVWVIQAFMGLLSLSVLWLFVEACDRWKIARSRWAVAAVGLFPFWIAGSVVPSSENLSTYVFALVAALALRGSSRSWVWAGFFSVGVIAARAPSGLLIVGFVLALLSQLRRKRTNPKVTPLASWPLAGWSDLRRYSVGFLIGVVLWGLPDAIHYGRPWESLLLYFDFNFLSGVSERLYGSQAESVYLGLFRAHFMHPVFGPIGLVIAAAGVKRWISLVRRRDPIAWAGLVYLMGHLLSAHKEPRFMVPLEMILVVFGVAEITRLARNPSTRVFALEWNRRRWGKAVVALALLVMTAVGAQRVIKPLGQAERVYLAGETLVQKIAPCAVLSRRKLSSTLLFADPRARPPAIPTAFWPGREDPVIWLDAKADCPDDGRVLIQSDRDHTEWLSAECTHEAVGIERFARSRSTWYACPARILKRLPRQEVRHLLVDRFLKWPSLPRFRGASADQLREWTNRYGADEGTLGDY